MHRGRSADDDPSVGEVELAQGRSQTLRLRTEVALTILFHVTLPDSQHDLASIGSAGPRFEVGDGAVVDVVVPAKKH